MQGESPAAIARKLGRHRCTIGRELKRNGAAKWGYHPEKAQQRYHAARKDCVKKRSLDYPPLRAYVYEKITDYWSPEQVCGRARILFPHDPRMHVAPETIYRALYRDDRLGKPLIPCLRQRRKKRRKRGTGLHRRGPKIPNRVSIEQRPKEVDQRQQCGHWEGDTVVGKNHRGAVATLVERKSLLLRAAVVPSKIAQLVCQAIIDILYDLPAVSRKTITFDNGTEFAAHEKITHDLKSSVYFAHPYCSNERARNENTNGLLRQYLPKGISFENLSQNKLDAIVHEINNRPRKSLGYRTPLEVFQSDLVALEC